jgi:hypothetical protein
LAAHRSIKRTPVVGRRKRTRTQADEVDSYTSEMPLSPSLREFAEVPGRFTEIPPGISVERFADERVCILQGSTWALIAGVNTSADDLDNLVAEVRSRVPQDKEPSWDLGPSTRPESAHEHLSRNGFRTPRDGHPMVFALALTTEPNAPRDVEVLRVETFDQYKTAREIAWEAFDQPEDRRTKERARLRQDFAEQARTNNPAAFLAMSDGKPAAVASAVRASRGVFLIGGATARWARGRGLYRALVRARWDYAMSLGTPALATHAVPETSYPILRQLGFEEVCKIHRLEDPGPANPRG